MREGDTLAGLAERLWGDASLWWKIAEANGLTGQAALVEGQALTLPAGVMRATHNAQTFQPYDPSETIGDTAPTTLQPTPKKNKCGVLGRVFLQIIALAVSTAIDFIFPGVGRVVNAALTSIITQGVGVATGIQEKFSWNQVALSAISAGVNARVSGIDNAFLRGATASALTQGVAVATGLQDKFSWSAVAAAGVGASVGAFASAHLSGAAIHKGGELVKPATWGNRIGAGLASGMSMAATRSLIDGTDFGDNLVAVLPDLIGQTIGGAFAASKGGSNWESQFKGIEAQGDADESAPYGALTKQPLKSNESSLGPIRITITRGYVDEQSFLDRLAGGVEFLLGAGLGFLRDMARGLFSLGDFAIRDVGGTVFYGIDEGIDALTPGDLPNPYRQSYIDYANAVNAGATFTMRAFTDFPGLARQVEATFAAATAASNAQASAFMRGATNPTASLVLNVATLPFVASRLGAVADLGQLGRVGRVGATAAEFEDAARGLRAADAAADVARMAAITREGIIGELDSVVQPHLATIRELDPSAVVGFRGSLASGVRGPHKGFAPFDPNNFDVDAFIVSDDLASRFPASRRFRDGGRIAEVREVQRAIEGQVRQSPSFAGLRPGRFTFRIVTERQWANQVSRSDPQYIFGGN